MENVTHDMAINALNREYMDEIRSIAANIVAEHYDPETQEPIDSDECEQYLTETIDGHEWVIYTHKAKIVAVVTDSPDAYEDEMGEKAPTVEAAAYFSMLADVRDMLSNKYFLDKESEKKLKAVEKVSE